MDDKPPNPPKPTGPQKPAEKPSAGELLSGLDNLLREESAGLELPPDDAVQGDDLSGLFGEGETAGKEAAPPLAARAAARARPSSRAGRQERRSQDQEAYRSLETYTATTPMGLQVSDDKMTIRISRITAQNTADEIFNLLRSQGVTGIDNEAIREAVTKASLGQPQYGVAVARGRPAAIRKRAEIVYHLPPDLTDGRANPLDRLKKLLESPSLDALKTWTTAVPLVSKGEVLAEYQPAEVEPGCDVYGGPVLLDNAAGPQLQAGDNTVLCDDGARCAADIYGYAGLLDDKPAVLPPLWVSPDHMQALFICLPAPSPPPAPTEQELHELIALRWIEFGLMEAQLQLIQRRLQQRQPLPASIVIAQGTAAVQGGNAQIKYSFDPFELLKWSQFQTLLTLKTPEAIQDALSELLGPAGESGLRFRAVRPGSVVAEKIPATLGTSGRDLGGDEIVADEGKDVVLEGGDGLSFTEDKLRCVADHFGYVCLHRDVQVHLIPPLWVPPDRTAVYFMNLPQAQPARYPALEEMTELLGRAKVQHGFSAERWVEILADLQGGRIRDCLVPIAQATPPQPGKDAAFEWAIRVEQSRPGKVLEDGSIDYRERSLFVGVKEKDLLGKLIHPQPGVPGKDVFGHEIRPPQPLNIEVVTDSRIYAEAAEDGAMLFYAEISGGIATKTQVKQAKSGTHERISIGVYAISSIEHDVDYTTGNVDFNGDVVIGGSVQPQFSVRATGSVTIGGYVEAGACVTAGKDILVKRGIVGASTELVAGGSVMSKFIQEATIRAGGDVKAGSYIFNASVRASGQVVVVGKGEGKARALVGGLIWAAQGITARSIGSPYNTSTRLVVGVDPEQVNRSEQVRANLAACQEKKMALLQSIGLTALDLDLIRQRLAQSPSAKFKQTILMTVRRIAKLAELEQNLQHELEEIAESQRELARRTTIQVSNELFAGVELRLGEQVLTLLEDRQKVSFRLVVEDEQERIQMGGPGASPAS